MFNDPNVKTIWQRRAERTGFQVWKGRKLSDMTDGEIENAFIGLASRYGISYIWSQSQTNF